MNNAFDFLSSIFVGVGLFAGFFVMKKFTEKFSNDIEVREGSPPTPLLFGFMFTITWLVLGIFLLTCISTESIKSLRLNEWGDFIAGWTAPLAFFWLILGYFQQGQELMKSTEAINLQTIEMKNTVQQHERLVKLYEKRDKDAEDIRKVAEENTRWPEFQFENDKYLLENLTVEVVNKGSSVQQVDSYRCTDRSSKYIICISIDSSNVFREGRFKLSFLGVQAVKDLVEIQFVYICKGDHYVIKYAIENGDLFMAEEPARINPPSSPIENALDLVKI